jgi:hypothetical protein
MEEVCRPTSNETCTSGLIPSTVCHLNIYTRRDGLCSYADLQNENKKLVDEMWNKNSSSGKCNYLLSKCKIFAIKKSSAPENLF